jgi:hypothetical protein
VVDPVRTETAARVVAAVMLCLGLFSLGFWNDARRQPGLDFYLMWSVAKAQRGSGFTLDSPYRDTEGYHARLLRDAAASGDAVLQDAAPRVSMDFTGTPFVYYLMGSLPGPYATALLAFRAAQLLAFALAVFVLARPLASMPTAAALAAATALAFDPLLLDVKNGNLGALLLFGLAMLGQWLSRPLAASGGVGRVHALLAPALLVLLAVIKPIVAGAALLMGLALLRAGSGFARAAALGSAVVALALFYLAPCALFDSLAVWGDWAREAFSSDARLAYNIDMGNYSGILLLAEGAGRSPGWAMQVTAFALAASLAGVLGWSGRRALAAVAQDARADPLAAAALGIVLLLALSPLVWSHYQVLAVLPALWLCRAPAGAPRVLGWLALVLVADLPRRVAMVWEGLPWLVLHVSHAYSWLLLWAGLLVVLRARLRAAAAG